MTDAWGEDSGDEAQRAQGWCPSQPTETGSRGSGASAAELRAVPAADARLSVSTDCGCQPDAGQTPAGLCAQTEGPARESRVNKPAEAAAGEAGEAGGQPGKQVKRALWRERLSEDCEQPTGQVGLSETVMSVFPRALASLAESSFIRKSII